MGIQCRAYYGDVEEGYSVFHQSLRKAKKAHKCYECGNAISPGEEYERVSGLYEGSWDHFHTCSRCLDLHESLKLFSCYPYAHFRIIGNLLDTAEDYIRDCMVPNLQQTYLAIPYYKKLILARRGGVRNEAYSKGQLEK